MDAKAAIGHFVRVLREQKSLTQEQLASKTGITYQYLSGLENGRENFSIDILDSLGKALDCPLPQLVAAAYAPDATASGLLVAGKYFRPQVPLPPGMKVSHLEAAMNSTQSIMARIKANP